MLSVQFHHFPSSIQHQIVRDMNLRELVKFSFCSMKTLKAVKSAEIPVLKLTGFLDKSRLYMEVRNSSDNKYQVSINPDDKNSEYKKGPEYIGFEGLRMYDYTEEYTFGGVDHTGIVILSEGQDILETSDRLIGYLKDLFVSVRSSEWNLQPAELKTPVILKKHFPKMDYLNVTNTYSLDRFITKESLQFLLEEFEVRYDQTIRCEAEEGYVYSKGFQSDFVNIFYPSWMHWDAIFNSTSESIELCNVQNLFSGDLNRFFKLWVSNEKMQNLTRLGIYLEQQDGLELPPDFLELVLEGIPNFHVEIEEGWDPARGQRMKRKISRIDGTMATVGLMKTIFWFEIEDEDEDEDETEDETDDEGIL